MKNIVILAGLAALATATPALADRGHGNDRHDNQRGDRHDNQRGDRHDNQRGDRHDSREGWGTYGAWGNNCPPGLRKKHNGCMAPGQARKRYNEGQRWNDGYGTRWSYNQIPYGYRQQYNLNPNDRYYYRDGYLYRVNRRSNLVEQVLSAILR